jgi:hypothetical protein
MATFASFEGSSEITESGLFVCQSQQVHLVQESPTQFRPELRGDVAIRLD